MSVLSLLSRAKRKSDFGEVRSAFDPQRTCRFHDDLETLDLNQGVTLRAFQSMIFFGALSDECLSKSKGLS